MTCGPTVIYGSLTSRDFMIPARNWTLGLIFLAVVIFLWVASGFLVNEIGTTYDKPFFLTYLNTGFMILYLPFSVYRITSTGSIAVKHDISRASIMRTGRLAAEFSFFWFISNLFNNASYFYTTVQSATIIACTSSFWTLLIGSIYGTEKFTARKLLPLMVSLIGITIITFQDGKSARPESAPKHMVLGDVLALLGAMAYGLYTSMLKFKVGDESQLNTKLFMGLVGLISSISMWPFLIVINYLGLESFELPPTKHTVVLILINGAAGMFGDLSWVLATLMTTPLVVAVGLSGTIPLSVLGDYLLHDVKCTFWYYVGAVIVFWSFVDINHLSQPEIVPETLGGQVC